MELESYAATAGRYEYIHDCNKQAVLSDDRTSRFIACAYD